MMNLPYQDKVDDIFINKVREISALLFIRPEWLMVVMAIETAKTFDPSIQNPRTKATGLIQFMPGTAKELKTTVDELRRMDRVTQMKYVYKYLSVYKGKMKSFEDVYLCVFYPAAVGKPLSYKLGISSERQKIIAVQNPAYDKNKDLVVEKWEIRDAIMKFVPQGFTM